jgi:outer membrane lipoprotein SlyB
MTRVSALASSKAFLATLALLGGLSLGAMTALAATQSRPNSAPTVADVAPVAALDGSSVADAVVGRAIDQSIDQALGDATQAGAGRVAGGRIGLRRLLIGKTERAEITIATDAGTKTILYTKGGISVVSGSSITIALSEGRHETFAIDSSTIVREKGKAITPADLSVGERAMAFGFRNADGTYTAKLIRCVTGKANPAAPNQPTPSPSGS